MTGVLATFLVIIALLAICGVIALMVAWDVMHRKGVGLPEDVRRYPIVGPALGNSLWTGERSADAVDVRRVS